MNIVVLAGGLSPERDVSLSSGTRICAALRKAGHNAVLVDLYYGLSALPSPVTAAFTAESTPAELSVKRSAPDLAQIVKTRSEGLSPFIGKNVVELCRAADITFLALHGDNGENGRVQAFFDMLGIRYTGSSYFGCAVAMNKFVTKQLLLAANIKTPFGVLLKESELKDLGDLALPLVVKPCSGGSSIGISIVRDEKGLANALCEAFRYEPEVLIETYIAGRELSCGVLGNTALPVIEIRPRGGFYDYAHKYQPGLTEEITPAPIPTELSAAIQAASLMVCRALKLEVYARIDFMLSADGAFYCLEANTLPGMTPTSLLPQEAAAVGIDYPSLCDRIVTLSLEKYR